MGLRLPRRTAAARHVTVRLDGAPPLEAAVVNAVDGGAELAILTPGAPPTRTLHRRQARLTGALGEHDAVLLAVGDRLGGLREGSLHAVWAGDPAQRRAFARVPAFRPVELVPEVRGIRRPPALEGITRDISAGGALLGGDSAAALFEGERVALRMALDDDGDVLAAGARVVRADAESAVAAVRLELVAPQDVERLARWVRAREIDALARLRG